MLRPWERLSRPARELVLSIAIGGEVAAGSALDRAADLSGAPPEDLSRLLREAVDAGVFEVSPDGGYWFHHPLQAEALESLLAGDERRRMHAHLARACEAGLVADTGPRTPGDVGQLTAVAGHHSLAGELDDAYAWTLRALQAAEQLGDRQSALTLLRKVVDLHPRVREPSEPLTDLLLRVRDDAAFLGEHEVEHAAVEALLAETDESEQPLLVSELLVRREHLRFSTGRGFLRVEPVRRAAELARPWPDSWQYGFALAEVAQASLWADAPDAQERSRRRSRRPRPSTTRG